MDDPRIEHLRGLIAQAIDLRDAARALIADLNEQMHVHVSTADDCPVQLKPRQERRKKPRT